MGVAAFFSEAHTLQQPQACTRLRGPTGMPSLSMLLFIAAAGASGVNAWSPAFIHGPNLTDLGAPYCQYAIVGDLDHDGTALRGAPRVRHQRANQFVILTRNWGGSRACLRSSADEQWMTFFFLLFCLVVFVFRTVRLCRPEGRCGYNATHQ